MHRSPSVIVLVAAVAAFTRAAGAQNPQQAPLRVAASSFASTEVHINARKIGTQWFEEDASLTGPSRIAITYGQPHSRGRRVEGGLIPVDTVWRFGANAATTLHTDVDMTLGDVRLEAGDYSLFVLYARTGWLLIVNRRTGVWGSDYDRMRDVARIPLTARTLAEPEESLSVYLVPESARPSQGYAELRGVLRIKWGRTELGTTWQVIR